MWREKKDEIGREDSILLGIYIYRLMGETELKDRFLGYLLIDYIEYELFEFEYDEMR